MFRRLRKGQSTAEYAIVIGLVIAAAVAMQVYVKRGLQGKIKDAVDYNDSEASNVIGKTTQYEPYYNASEMTSSRQAKDKEDVGSGGSVTRTTEDTSARTGTVAVSEAQNP